MKPKNMKHAEMLRQDDFYDDPSQKLPVSLQSKVVTSSIFMFVTKWFQEVDSSRKWFWI